MPKKTQDHIHKLKRLRFKSGNSVYFCALDCNFKVQVPLSLGKKSICWRCGEPFNMNEYSIRLARPHCEKCHKSKDEKDSSFDSETKLTPILTTTVSELGYEPLSGMSLADRLSQALHANKPAEAEDEEI